MIESDFLKFVIWLCWVAFFGWTGYELGYEHARDRYRETIKYRCHDEVVYRWSGGYWEKIDKSCKSEEQMKGLT